MKFAAGEELVKRGGKPRGSRGRTYWYARYRMWTEARKLDTPVRQALNAGHRIDQLGDLTVEERRQCLLRVHEYIRRHRNLQLQYRGFLERGKGPSFDAQVDDPSFEYNGEGPTNGRVFKWYRKAVFQDQLRRLGWTAVRCRTA